MDWRLSNFAARNSHRKELDNRSGAVVTKDIPEYSNVAGKPAIALKSRI